MSRLFAVVMVASACAVARADDTFTVPNSAARVLQQKCIDCHAGESAEGNVQFDNFSKLKKSERLELLNKAQEQLYFGLMPPEDAEQPSDAEVIGWGVGTAIVHWWVARELERRDAPRWLQASWSLGTIGSTGYTIVDNHRNGVRPWGNNLDHDDCHVR